MKIWNLEAQKRTKYKINLPYSTRIVACHITTRTYTLRIPADLYSTVRLTVRLTVCLTSILLDGPIRQI